MWLATARHPNYFTPFLVQEIVLSQAKNKEKMNFFSRSANKHLIQDTWLKSMAQSCVTI